MLGGEEKGVSEFVGKESHSITQEFILHVLCNMNSAPFFKMVIFLFLYLFDIKLLFETL